MEPKVFFPFFIPGRGGREENVTKVLLSGRLRRRSNPLPVCATIFLDRNGTPSCVASIAKKWYSFQMPSLELCIPFRRGFKCTVLHI